MRHMRREFLAAYHYLCLCLYVSATTRLYKSTRTMLGREICFFLDQSCCAVVVLAAQNFSVILYEKFTFSVVCVRVSTICCARQMSDFGFVF